MNPETTPAPAAAGRNLVISLDGTWNNQDSSTNVLHLHHLATGTDSHDVGGAGQLKYYDAGVGTGLLDGVSGGAFGIGLEENVREAYNWLVRHYQPGDRIFIFGFSRGAYTARSLAGFITHCGLLKRGAPMTVGQLWGACGQIARKATGDENWWERLAGVRPPPWRSRTELERDGLTAASAPAGRGKRALQKARQRDEAERLLMASTWDGVRIHFLGIYDTVGSMGIEALAVPGVRGKLSLAHNMDLSPLLVTVRHALALDEHRDSFLHTPLRHVSSSGIALGSAVSGGVDIVQRWFPGAHSNVGGGYEDGTPAGHVLEWMLKEAVAAGLKLSARAELPLAGEGAGEMAGRLRDSYAEFASPVWSHLLRGKRCYRRVAPPDELRGRGADKEGERLSYPREEVDEMVWEMVNEVDGYCPVNLAEYADRVPVGAGAGEQEMKARTKLRDALPAARPPWLGRTGAGAAWLAAWSVLATLGLAAAGWLFFPGTNLSGWGACWPWLACGHAALLVLVDWWENQLNYSLARRPGDPATGKGRPWAEPWLDCIFWLRAGGVVLCFTGAGWLAWHLICWLLGRDYGGLMASAGWWTLAGLSGAAVAIAAGGMACSAPRRLKKPATPWRWLPAVVAVTTAVAVMAQWRPLSSGESPGQPESGELLAGRLLLLAMVAGYFWNSFLFWVGEPMSNARMGGVTDLQKCYSGSRVKEVFSTWTARLTPTGEIGQEAPLRWMQHNVRLCLVRDWLGFIPIYTLFLGTGLWFAQYLLTRFGPPGDCLPWLPQWGLHHSWVWLAVLTAGADYLENAWHWFYLRKPDRAPSAAMHLCCVVWTGLKFVVFFVLLLLTWATMLYGGWKLLANHRGDAGLRGQLALGALVATMTMTFLYVAAWVKSKWQKAS